MLRTLIIILILVISHFLSTRERAWLGAIVPTIYVIIIWRLLMTTELNFSEGRLPILLGFTIFLGIWANGRESFKKKRKKELDKMKSYDMK